VTFASNRMGNFQRSPVKINFSQDRSKVPHIEQIDFADSSTWVTPETGREAQRTIAGIAFEAVSFCDNEVLEPSKLFAVLNVRDVLAACGILQRLGPRFSVSGIKGTG
jgi:hypothetical protein